MVKLSDLPRNLGDLVTAPVSADPPEFYERAAREARAAGSDGFHGTVISTPSGGQVRVAISGEAKTAGIAPTAKAIQNGDRVKLIKTGGKWIVYDSLTWHEPPKVGPPPPTTTPAPASTASGSTSYSPTSIRYLPYASNSSSWTSWGDEVVNAWHNDLINFASRVNSAINSLRSRLDSIQGTVNTNATRLNQTRDVATGTRDSIGGLREGALQDGVVKP